MSNADMRLLVGSGLGKNFRWIDGSRTWNGIIRYTSENDVDTITNSPSLFPSNKLSQMPSSNSLMKIETILDGTESADGIMFDILAVKDVIIRGMDVHVGSNGTEFIELWNKSGSYKNYKRHPGAWTFVASQNLNAEGFGKGTPLPESIFHEMTIPASQTLAIYVTSQSNSVISSIMTGTGDISTSNSELQIFVGTAKSYKFGRNVDGRHFNGALYYVLDSSESIPTSVPSIRPSDYPNTFPTREPVEIPVTSPTSRPIKQPFRSPTKSPTSSSTSPPTKAQTSSPTETPTSSSTKSPTSSPTKAPTLSPTKPIITLTYRPGDLTKSENGLRLSTGLTSKIIATSGMKGTTFYLTFIYI